jgi:hypothetical protein
VSGIALTGLRAENPLAFLAALGALSLADEANDTTVRMGWQDTDGTWTPFLLGDGLETADAIVQAITYAHHQRKLDEELGWAKDIMKLTRLELRELLIARAPDSGAACLLAACVAELPLRRDERSVPYTPFRLIPRVGRARFLDVALRESRAGIDHIYACLFKPWVYAKRTQSLCWDPATRVPARALMAESPTHAGTRGVPGALLLAIRGLTCFPLLTTRRGAKPPGVIDRDRFVWPIWGEPLELPLVQMLLSMRWLHRLDVDNERQRRQATRQLSAHGIIARFSAPRVRRGQDSEAFGWGVPTAIVADGE